MRGVEAVGVLMGGLLQGVRCLGWGWCGGAGVAPHGVPAPPWPHEKSRRTPARYRLRLRARPRAREGAGARGWSGLESAVHPLDVRVGQAGAKGADDGVAGEVDLVDLGPGAEVVQVLGGDAQTRGQGGVAMSTPLGPGVTARNGPTLRETSGMSERGDTPVAAGLT